MLNREETNTPAKEGAAAEVEKPWQGARSVLGPTEMKVSLTNLSGVTVQGKAPPESQTVSSAKFQESTFRLQSQGCV